MVDEVQNFRNLGYTIGGSIIFPRKKIDGKMTINGARGFNAEIADRFDLTLECIRRYYSSEASPLEDTFKRYSSFFELFKSFRGYVDFFLLQDLVSPNYDQINYFTQPELVFKTPPIPQTKAVYLEYMENTITFLQKRNKRMQDYSRTYKDPEREYTKLKDHVCWLCKNTNSYARIVEGEVRFELSRDEYWNIESIAYSDTRHLANIICIKCKSLKFGKQAWTNY